MAFSPLVTLLLLLGTISIGSRCWVTTNR